MLVGLCFFFHFQYNIKRGRVFPYPMHVPVALPWLLGMDSICWYRYMNHISGIIPSVSIDILLLYFTHVLHDTHFEEKNQFVNNFPNWLSFLDYQKQHTNMMHPIIFNLSNNYYKDLKFKNLNTSLIWINHKILISISILIHIWIQIHWLSCVTVVIFLSTATSCFGC